MAEELVELGFEGIDRFATHFHDPCHDYLAPRISKRRPHWHDRKRQEREQTQNDNRPSEQRGLEQQEHREQQDRGPPPDDDDYDDYDDKASNVYAQDTDKRKRERDWGDSRRDNRSEAGRDDRSAVGGRERGFNNASGSVVRREPVPYGYAAGYPAAPLPPSPPVPLPPQWAYASRPSDARYGDRFVNGRRPLPPRRRESSYSPPRRSGQGRNVSPPRRKRSHSPNHHRVAATIMGALAGGLVGNSSEKANKWTTVAGAVVGGLGGRELEKAYDRREDKKMSEEERRERRRSERGRR
ncbi:hypothetical protein K504DRAFT_468464 [Pleomassaria siparia CBS 279.74]|uniref:Glycine zipper 2TM domain-containing protein n=1 Tax=Pleomassaria siparia CBS 279.74 TaxID=1314801 RepID=A0A6G1K5D5_9PLEO|nr:hypothetical protein K504DRAFT_468464 [Pleomassaria siparia CBS 279.74]